MALVLLPGIADAARTPPDLAMLLEQPTSRLASPPPLLVVICKDQTYALCATASGICFQGSRGQTFPGFAEPLAKDETICSCKATVPDPSSAEAGFQIAGPYPCQSAFFRNCQKAVANTRTGSTIHGGAPTGVAEFLALRQDGPPIDRRSAP
jgi:hypothetical protein